MRERKVRFAFLFLRRCENTPPSLSLTHASSLDRPYSPTTNFGQDLGVNIIRRALTHPARTIFSYAGKGPFVSFPLVIHPTLSLTYLDH